MQTMQCCPGYFHSAITHAQFPRGSAVTVSLLENSLDWNTVLENPITRPDVTPRLSVTTLALCISVQRELSHTERFSCGCLTSSICLLDLRCLNTHLIKCTLFSRKICSFCYIYFCVTPRALHYVVENICILALFSIHQFHFKVRNRTA